MLVDKQIRLSLARQPQHCVVKIFNPSAHRLAVAQLNGDSYLAIAE